MGQGAPGGQHPPHPVAEITGKTWLFAAVIVGPILAAYANSFKVPFVLDDSFSINGNPSIRSWHSALFPPGDSYLAGRPLINLSFAINYFVSGFGVGSYHWLNLIIHCAAALTIFGILSRTLTSAVVPPEFTRNRRELALAVTVLWALHPINSEAVTYISQRTESLAGFFYLQTLYCFLRSLASKRSWGWQAASVLSCNLGALTKEIIITAPLVIFLYDGVYVSRSFRQAWSSHRRYYLSVLTSWLLIAYSMLAFPRQSVGFVTDVGSFEYAVTSCRTLIRYLFLALWPHPLVLDYGMGTLRPALSPEVILWVSAAALLCLGVAVAFRRAPRWGFLAVWFLLILLPAHSFVPVPGQPMAEHRLYLSVFAMVAAIVFAAYLYLRRWAFPLLAVMAAAYGTLTFLRNTAYSSELAIWRDTLAKCPDNARAHNNLGVLLASDPQTKAEALKEYRTAIQLEPNYWEARVNYGAAIADEPGKVGEAIAEYRAALKANPFASDAHNNLGVALAKDPSKVLEAIHEYQLAIRSAPNHWRSHLNLGAAYAALPDHLKDAVREYRQSISMNPDSPDAHFNLALALGRLNDPAGAIKEHREALRLNPQFAEAHFEIGLLLEKAPDREKEAIAEFKAALQSAATSARTHFHLGVVYSRTADTRGAAIVEYREAIRLDPHFLQAYLNLAPLLSENASVRADSIALYRQAIKLIPSSPELYYNLGNALSDNNQIDESIDAYRSAVALKPDFSEAHLNLGSLLASGGHSLAEAVQEFREAVRSAPNSADAHFNLGLALAASPNQSAEAIEHLRTAAKLRPTDSAIQQNLDSVLKAPALLPPRADAAAAKPN